MLAGTVYCVWPVLPGKFGSLSICGYSAQGQCQTTGSRWKQCTKAKPLREVKEFWRAETCSCCDSRDSIENGKVWGCRLCWRAFNGIGTWLALQVNRGHVLKEAEMWRWGVVNLTNLFPGMCGQPRRTPVNITTGCERTLEAYEVAQDGTVDQSGDSDGAAMSLSRHCRVSLKT